MGLWEQRNILVGLKRKRKESCCGFLQGTRGAKIGRQKSRIGNRLRNFKQRLRNIWSYSFRNKAGLRVRKAEWLLVATARVLQKEEQQGPHARHLLDNNGRRSVHCKKVYGGKSITFFTVYPPERHLFVSCTLSLRIVVTDANGTA
jgi:hypothetical protein